MLKKQSDEYKSTYKIIIHDKYAHIKRLYLKIDML